MLHQIAEIVIAVGQTEWFIIISRY